jgi:hypothetical protein
MISYVRRGTQLVWTAPGTDRRVLVTATTEPNQDGLIEAEDELGWVAHISIEDCHLYDIHRLQESARDYRWI